MNRIIWFLKGYFIIDLTGASPQWALNKLAQNNIAFWNVYWIDDFTIRLCIFRRDYARAQECIIRSMCDCAYKNEVGLIIVLRNIIRRPVLIIFAFISLIVLTILPQYVLFYQVVGNETVQEQAILRALDEIGIGFATRGTKIKPQWIKNHMLNILPDLEWITVTQNGCRAQVVVRERIHKPKTKSRKGLANVVATQSGVITEQSVYAGQPLCNIGDTVNKGDVLVSGLVDLERTYAITRAEAEIFARTWRSSVVVTPRICLKKQYENEMRYTLWLQIGKKRIKILGNSGISSVRCDKMSKTRELSLPGDLSIPVSITVETYLNYIPVEFRQSQDDVVTGLQDYVRLRAVQDMSAGEIRSESWNIVETDSLLSLSGTLECHEMIATTIDVAWDKGGIFRDGENR